MTKDNEPSGPDFSLGFEISQLSNESITSGHVSGQDAILVKQKDDYFILAAFCSHYHAPLQDGLVVDNEIRCPWHHARFDLKTGTAICAPAFDALRAWRVEIVDGKAFARERLHPAQKRPLGFEDKIKTIVMVGAKHPIFLIVDRGPAHRSKKTKAFVEGLSGKLQLFSCPHMRLIVTLTN